MSLVKQLTKTINQNVIQTQDTIYNDIVHILNAIERGNIDDKGVDISCTLSA